MKKIPYPFMNPLLKGKKLNVSHREKIYIKKFGNISNFKIWVVNGEYIRKNICEDFVNAGQHYAFKFIPKNEFWISKEFSSKEEKFYIDHLLIENRLMKRGFSYDNAYDAAAKNEKTERMRTKTAKKLRKMKLKKEILKKIHKKILIKIGDLKIWLIHGEFVRDEFLTEFYAGGHDLVYHFVPKNEVWIDDDISLRERKFIIIHELRERVMMSSGLTYREAHFIATELEDYSRKHPKNVGKVLEKLKGEIQKQKLF